MIFYAVDEITVGHRTFSDQFLWISKQTSTWTVKLSEQNSNCHVSIIINIIIKVGVVVVNKHTFCRRLDVLKFVEKRISVSEEGQQVKRRKLKHDTYKHWVIVWLRVSDRRVAGLWDYDRRWSKSCNKAEMSSLQ